jgi:hypothetical protein
MFFSSYINDKNLFQANPGIFHIDDFIEKDSIIEQFDIAVLNKCNEFLESGQLTLPEIIMELDQIRLQYQTLLIHMENENYEDEEELAADDIF